MYVAAVAAVCTDKTNLFLLYLQRFSVIVNSCEVGVTKPHQKMYETALSKTQVAPEDTAFIGHKKTELGSYSVLVLPCPVVAPTPLTD
jgi:histidinol phosphatase-like enzyme